jgi:AAA+ ATPase superfamily predicted ATPase
VDKFKNDSVYYIRMQMLAEEKKLLTQSTAERMLEIKREISELQLKYSQQTFKDAFGEYSGDDMDDPADYYRWGDLEEEMMELTNLLWNANQDD